MDTTLGPVRKWDLVVAALFSLWGGYLMVLNAGGAEGVDAGPAIVPTFLAVTIPLAWRRARPIGAGAAALIAFAIHFAIFGELIRCGAGFPVFFVVAYTTASVCERKQALAGLGIATLGIILVGATDSLWGGWGPLYLMLPIAWGLWAAGRVVRSRTVLARRLERKNRELQHRRDERAAMEVALDRAKLSGELEALLQQRLASLSAAAEAGSRTADPRAARELLEQIEYDSRRTLEEMRQIVGVLRGSDRAQAPTSPAPSVTHLDALLARSTRADARITVDGDPRTLPAAVELSAYRIVEQLVATLHDDPSAEVEVRVRFLDDALDIRVLGPIAKGADVKAAAARARERVALHRGSLELRVERGRIDAVAQLPILATV